MKTKQATQATPETGRQGSGIYLSITAESHEEMCRKIDELHAGFCRPAPKQAKGRKG